MSLSVAAFSTLTALVKFWGEVVQQVVGQLLMDARWLAAAGRVQHLSQRLERVGMRAVEDVHASAFGVDHAGFFELAEVVADRRFGQADGDR